jgi:hypothetical protein
VEFEDAMHFLDALQILVRAVVRRDDHAVPFVARE